VKLKHPTNHKHALKSALVIVGIAFVFTIFIFIPIAQTQQEAARQAQIQKQEDDRVEREKAAEAVKTKAEYDKCIADANAHYSKGLDGIPDDLYGSARVLAIQAVGDLVESFKEDCDRQYSPLK
jgi:Na+-transporting methylmalonyl-CoA/oxaloacetate decarboxylase gamma subunit